MDGAHGSPACSPAVIFQCAGRERWFDHQFSDVAASALEDEFRNNHAVRVCVGFDEALRGLLRAAEASFRDERFLVIPIGTPQSWD